MSAYKYVDAINDPDFYRRVQYHVIKAAVAIANESAQTANHANRVKLATNAMTGKMDWNICVSLTLCNWAIEALSDPLAATDQQIYDAISAFWDALSLTVA